MQILTTLIIVMFSILGVAVHCRFLLALLKDRRLTKPSAKRFRTEPLCWKMDEPRAALALFELESNATLNHAERKAI